MSTLARRLILLSVVTAVLLFTNYLRTQRSPLRSPVQSVKAPQPPRPTLSRLPDNEYFDAGRKLLKVEYLPLTPTSGVSQYVRISYTSNRTVRAMETIIDGHETGVSVRFTEAGNLEMAAFLEDGKIQAGRYDQYDKSRRMCQRWFSRGEVQGLDQQWLEKGERIESFLIDGQLVGTQREFAADGSLNCERYYEQGREVRRIGFFGGRKNYEDIANDGSGFHTLTAFGNAGETQVIQRTDLKTRESTETRFDRDCHPQLMTESMNHFPIRAASLNVDGTTNAVMDYTTGIQSFFSPQGRLIAQEYSEYHRKIWRKEFDGRGQVILTKALGVSPIPVPGAQTTVRSQQLPGERGSFPETFQALFELERGLGQAVLDEDWTRTISHWCYDPAQQYGSVRAKFPRSAGAMGGRSFTQGFIARTRTIEAIAILNHVVEGPGWLQLTIYADKQGLPSGQPLARSWLSVGKYCPVPGGGLLVFPLPPIEWQVGGRYWMEYACEKGMTVNWALMREDDYPDGKLIGAAVSDGKEFVAGFQLVEHCGPVPLQTKIVPADDRPSVLK